VLLAFVLDGGVSGRGDSPLFDGVVSGGGGPLFDGGVSGRTAPLFDGVESFNVVSTFMFDGGDETTGSAALLLSSLRGVKVVLLTGTASGRGSDSRPRVWPL